MKLEHRQATDRREHLARQARGAGSGLDDAGRAAAHRVRHSGASRPRGSATEARNSAMAPPATSPASCAMIAATRSAPRPSTSAVAAAASAGGAARRPRAPGPRRLRCRPWRRGPRPPVTAPEMLTSWLVAVATTTHGRPRLSASSRVTPPAVTTTSAAASSSTRPAGACERGHVARHHPRSPWPEDEPHVELGCRRGERAGDVRADSVGVGGARRDEHARGGGLDRRDIGRTYLPGSTTAYAAPASTRPGAGVRRRQRAERRIDHAVDREVADEIVDRRPRARVDPAPVVGAAAVRVDEHQRTRGHADRSDIGPCATSVQRSIAAGGRAGARRRQTASQRRRCPRPIRTALVEREQQRPSQHVPGDHVVDFDVDACDAADQRVDELRRDAVARAFDASASRRRDRGAGRDRARGHDRPPGLARTSRRLLRATGRASRRHRARPRRRARARRARAAPSARPRTGGRARASCGRA